MGARAVDQRPSGDALGGLIPQARFTTMVILLLNFGLYAATTIYAMKGSGGLGVRYRRPNVVCVWGQGSLLDFARRPVVAAGDGRISARRNSAHPDEFLGAVRLGARQVEEVYGTSRFLVLYFLATVGGFLASTLFSHRCRLGPLRACSD